MRGWFEGIVSSLAYSLADEVSEAAATPPTPTEKNRTASFLLLQHGQMPDFLRKPLFWLTLLFDLSGIPLFGRSFRHLSQARKRALLSFWRHSWLGPCRDFVRLYESLTCLAALDKSTALLSRNNRETSELERPPARCEILVIGSGPGSATTAAILAEAGRAVLILEEGSDFGKEAPAFSTAEMASRYRNGGLTPALGATKVAYVEGCCIGGGSEINSGLYHRTPPETLEEWQREYSAEISEGAMREHFEQCERDLSISYLPGRAPEASLRLHQGAERLGWRSVEVPRWFAYSGGEDASGAPIGTRQTMSRTYLPRAQAAGASLFRGTRVVRVRAEGGRWRAECVATGGRRFTVEAEHIFVGAGAIQTPLLLRRSGILANVGEQLQMHPTVKAVALFPEEVNHEALGVPVHQVKEFSPLISLGCSISSQPYLAMGMSEHPEARQAVLQGLRKAGIYYGMIKPEGRGTVRSLPGFRDALVRFTLTEQDHRHLATSLVRLSEALLSGGAQVVYPAIAGSSPVKSTRDLGHLGTRLAGSGANAMTIHLFSSCPMGEDRLRCAADSFGRVHGHPGLHLCDASLLPTAPGVNPQGSIMALARRNALHFLQHARS